MVALAATVAEALVVVWAWRDGFPGRRARRSGHWCGGVRGSRRVTPGSRLLSHPSSVSRSRNRPWCSFPPFDAPTVKAVHPRPAARLPHRPDPGSAPAFPRVRWFTSDGRVRLARRHSSRPAVRTGKAGRRRMETDKFQVPARSHPGRRPSYTASAGSHCKWWRYRKTRRTRARSPRDTKQETTATATGEGGIFPIHAGIPTLADVRGRSAVSALAGPAATGDPVGLGLALPVLTFLAVCGLRHLPFLQTWHSLHARLHFSPASTSSEAVRPSRTSALPKAAVKARRREPADSCGASERIKPIIVHDRSLQIRS